MKIFFATDIHGSEICWRKFLNSAAFYKADMVILGGDVTGKVMIPIVAHNGYWQVTVRGESQRIENRESLEEVQRQIRNRGSYPAIVSPDELRHLSEHEGAVDQRFSVEMMHSLDRWLDMADTKLKGGQIGCILNGGNDDIFEIDDLIESSPCVTFAEGKVLDLGGFSLVAGKAALMPAGADPGLPTPGGGAGLAGLVGRVSRACARRLRSASTAAR